MGAVVLGESNGKPPNDLTRVLVEEQRTIGCPIVLVATAGGGWLSLVGHCVNLLFSASVADRTGTRFKAVPETRNGRLRYLCRRHRRHNENLVPKKLAMWWARRGGRRQLSEGWWFGRKKECAVFFFNFQFASLCEKIKTGLIGENSEAALTGTMTAGTGISGFGSDGAIAGGSGLAEFGGGPVASGRVKKTHPIVGANEMQLLGSGFPAMILKSLRGRFILFALHFC